MASNQTDKYKLNQWTAEDQVVREEFNTDNAKIDAALAELETKKAEQDLLTQLAAQVAQKYGDDRKLFYTGSYVGDGVPATRSYPVPFRPSFVIVFRVSEPKDSIDQLCVLGIPEIQFYATHDAGTSTCQNMFSFVNNGFQIHHQTLYQYFGFNIQNISYRYLAIR